jgi:cell division protease FtsH
MHNPNEHKSDKERDKRNIPPRPPRRDVGPRGPGEPEKKPPGPGGEFHWRRVSKTLLFWALVFMLAIYGVNLFSGAKKRTVEITYTEFLQQLEADNIEEVVFIERDMEGDFADSYAKTVDGHTGIYEAFKLHLPFDDPDLLDRLTEAGVQVLSKKPGTNWAGILISTLPWLLLIFFWLFMMRQMQGGQRGVFSFGKSRAKLLTEDRPKVTFADVAGCAEAKQELQEIIEFLRNPQKFQKLGGRIPKGALLLGPPGTGKTLLARAVAGEADVPFLSMSGSDFVEMFVGVGASRVRDLFEQGKSNAPCIIFIDEIDAVGRHRGAGLGGGHDEREQTLNQLLVEMDGFESNEGVILLAATNRPDVLDPALLRPGRFDRQIVVDQPDVKGRAGILRVHMKKIKADDSVEPDLIARGTPGLSGADLANLVNEAALLAARKSRDSVMMEDFEAAKDKVMLGTERRSLVISDKERKLTAYHEAGHALVAKLTPGTDPVHKVTIVPRGMALGLTHYLPIDDRHTYSRSYLEGQLRHLLGGRAAELVVFGEVTTGAGNDLERATTLARKMVCEWGMSEKIGPLTFGQKQQELFLGREIQRHADYSESTAQEIDAEIRRIVEQAEEGALGLLREKHAVLDALAEALLERESLDGEEVDLIVSGEGLPPLPEKVEPPEPSKTRTEDDVPIAAEKTDDGQTES